MNTPNKLTLVRILLAPIFMIFFVLDDFFFRMLGLVLFLVAAFTDLADGYYARKFGVITGFGKFMDPLADKILVSSALITFVSLHHASPLPVILIIGREFSITGLRLLAAYRGVIIPPTGWAKLKTFLQLCVVGIVMAYIGLLTGLEYFGHSSEWLSGLQIQSYLDLLMWITAVVTVWTGADYIVKYFYMIKSVLK